MVAKLFAALLVVLCVLPATAPFSTDGPADSLGSRDAGAAHGTAIDVALVGDPNDDAVTLERADFLQQSRLCARVAASSSASHPVLEAFRVAITPTASTLDTPALLTVLRI